MAANGISESNNPTNYPVNGGIKMTGPGAIPVPQNAYSLPQNPEIDRLNQIIRELQLENLRLTTELTYQKNRGDELYTLLHTALGNK
jgi:hypothetical protein